MALAIIGDAKPDPIDVKPLGPGSKRPADLDSSAPVFVPGLSIKIPMPAVTAAGVRLAYCVLAIIVFSIVCLAAYLCLMDFKIAADISDAYKKVSSVGATGAEFSTIKQFESLYSELSKAKADSNFQLTAEAIDDSKAMSASIAQMPSVSSDDKSKMAHCAPPPTDGSRVNVVDQCLRLLDDLKSAIIADSVSVARAQIASDASNKINDQRLAFHNFWIQAAQLILLNLLLPLVTALFGYVFGTQQVHPSPQQQ
jgi:hypothetical protein